MNPWFAVAETGKTDEARGEVWFGELAWSGSWKIAAEITDTGRLHVSGGIHDFDFNWRLKPGDEFSTPLFVAGFSAEGMGGASRRLHAYQLAEVLPKPQNKQLRPVIYNSWYATTFDINVEQQIKLARQARDLGIDQVLLGGDGWPSENLIELAGNALEGGYFINHLDFDGAAAKPFRDEYKTKYQKNAELNSYMVHDALVMVIDAIKRAKSIKGEDIKKALDTCDLQAATGANGDTMTNPITGHIKIGPNHDPVGKTAWLTKIIGPDMKFQESFAAEE
jgi:hypothetical protein